MKRTVITGLGVITPSGIGVEEHWQSILAGELRVAPIEGYDVSSYETTIAGQVRGFTADEHVDQRLIIQTDRWTWLSLAAAQQALDDAKYDPASVDPYATSVVMAAGYGGNEFGQREIQAMWHDGPQAVTAYQSIAWFYAASAGQTSIRHTTKGPASVFVAGDAGGLDSLGGARRAIRRQSSAVLAGGAESSLNPYGLVCQITNGLMTTSRDPRTGYRPFDAAANGYAPGEGAAVLMVESLDAARERGAPQIYGEIVGYAATHDGRRVGQPPTGNGLELAMRRALADASLSPQDIGLVIADGAGTPARDAAEARAINAVFGDGHVPVTVPRGFTGRLGAGTTVNVANALLALRDRVAPAVGNLGTPGDYQLDLVRTPRELHTDAILINARGHGGFNSSIVVQRFPEEDTQ